MRNGFKVWRGFWLLTKELTARQSTPFTAASALLIISHSSVLFFFLFLPPRDYFYIRGCLEFATDAASNLIISALWLTLAPLVTSETNSLTIDERVLHNQI